MTPGRLGGVGGSYAADALLLRIGLGEVSANWNADVKASLLFCKVAIAGRGGCCALCSLFEHFAGGICRRHQRRAAPRGRGAPVPPPRARAPPPLDCAPLYMSGTMRNHCTPPRASPHTPFFP